MRGGNQSLRKVFQHIEGGYIQNVNNSSEIYKLDVIVHIYPDSDPSHIIEAKYLDSTIVDGEFKLGTLLSYKGSKAIDNLRGLEKRLV